ncbi:MAG: CDP-diacylglycerol--glycerol-3-phosphate 3-phosphatidyltransferase [Bacillota bacterium]|jgi:CDP-diacylglycerol--glycerol-3-phosphate 3-phosphatidyltransferase
MNLPNRITLARFMLVLIMIGVMVFPYETVSNVNLGSTLIPLPYFVALVLFVVASFTDFLDGYLARKLNLVTNFGKFLDPFADKVLTNSAFILLMITPNWVEIELIRVPAWIVIIMIIRDLAVDGIRMIGVSQGKVIAANKIGKLKTVIQIIAIISVFLNDALFAFLNLPNGFTITDFILYLAALISLISLISYLYNNRGIFNSHE